MRFPAMALSRLLSCVLSILACLVGTTVAADFPTPYNSEPDPMASPPTPAAAAAGMTLPSGFRVQVFAAEPGVQNPIAMAWDARGRLWVAENFTYAERTKRFDLGLRDRVLIFEDTDHDGVADQRTVFTDDAQMLTSIEVGRGGVWLLCPPQLLFLPDANADDVPDGPPQVVLDGFTVAQSNYHNFANGLRWGPDGWLYGRCGHSCPGRLGAPGTPDDRRIPIEGGIWRFHPERKVVEVLCHGTTNPWGHDWDENGELFFINTVNGHLWHLMPGAHFKESFGADPNPGVYDRLDMIADHWHFDTKGAWSDSREGKANALGGGHAHIGMMIYQADQWPAEWRNRLFTLNMHGRRTNVERLEREGSAYVGRHQADIFLASDPWFRGIDLGTGPDGSAFVLDWSDTGECHESTGVHRTSGRIFRISHGNPAVPDLADLALPDGAALQRLVRHPNVWYDRQARRRLADGHGPAGAKETLQALVSDSSLGSPQRLRALWSGNALGSLDRGHLLALLQEKDEHLRVWAVRFLTDAWPLDTITGPLPGTVYPDEPEVTDTFVRLAETDPSSLVRLSLASVLQRLPVAKRAALGRALAAHPEDAADHSLPSMVWYGLIPLATTAPAELRDIAATTVWPDLLRWIARSLSGPLEKQPGILDPLLTLAGKADTAKQKALLQGISDGLQGWRRAPKPGNWDAFVAAAGNPGDSLMRDLGAVFGDGRALDEVRRVALDGKADMAMREAALRTLIDNKPPDLRQVCESLLGARILNATAVRGLALFDDVKIGQSLAATYGKFYPAERPAVMDTLVSRPSFAGPLLDEVARGKIPRADLTAFHARQILAFKDDPLTKQLREVWGDVRESAADKRALIARLKSRLTPEVLAQADRSQGRLVFQNVCSACHTLYGQGGKVGPDLTGSGRANLDYLLENLADPSAEVAADYRMTILTLADGRVLSGVVASRSERTVTLRLLTEETVLERSAIAKEETLPISLMPEGLLLAFSPTQVRDLLAYLMHPVQVPLPAP